MQQLKRLLYLPSRSLLIRSLSNATSNDVGVYDMVVVGGGMVGLALACAVGQTPSLSSKRVLLLESSISQPPLTTADNPYSNRVCSLSLGSVELLKRLNVWNKIISMRCKAFKKLHVWDACSNACISFSPQDFSFNIPLESFGSHDYDTSHVTFNDSDDVMGYVVENNVILRALSDQIDQLCDNVDVKRGTSVTTLVSTNDQSSLSNPWIELNLSGDTKIQTKLLIGADGARSHIREMAGFKTVGWKYEQTGVVATLDLEQGFAENSVAWQRFIPTGPIAVLPLSDTQSSLVWTTTPSHAKQLLDMHDEQFVDALNSALFEEFPKHPVVESANEFVRNILHSVSPDLVPTRQYPPTITNISSRGAFPLSLMHVPHYVKSRITLIGDAAHHVHPLAGLGVNLGFGDVSCLHRELVSANDIGEEWGFLPRLLSYETSRQRHNIPVLSVIDSLQKVFSTSYSPVVLIRSVGLQFTNALWPVKDFIINHAQKAN